MSNQPNTNPIDPRENADTATENAAPSGTDAETIDTKTNPAPNGHPVTSTILRHDGEAYYANDIAHGGTWAYEGTLGRSYTDNWRGTIRAKFAPRTDEEARNMQGREVIAPSIMEAVFYGSFGEAHRIMRAAVAAIALRRERDNAMTRRRRAAKAAQNAPETVDAANAPADNAERF